MSLNSYPDLLKALHMLQPFTQRSQIFRSQRSLMIFTFYILITSETHQSVRRTNQQDIPTNALQSLT